MFRNQFLVQQPLVVLYLVLRIFPLYRSFSKGGWLSQIGVRVTDAANLIVVVQAIVVACRHLPSLLTVTSPPVDFASILYLWRFFDLSLVNRGTGGRILRLFDLNGSA